MKQKQLSFYGLENKNFKKTHGGEHSIGKRKGRRPFSSSKPMHLVLRCSKQWGQRSFRNYKNFKLVNFYINKFSKKFNISIYKYSINSNHLHLLLRTKDKKYFQYFLSSLAGTIAFKLKGHEVLNETSSNEIAKESTTCFWAYLAFSRVLTWGKEFKILLNYVLQNQLEASGQITYKPRYPK